jgi:hypothetical protein
MEDDIIANKATCPNCQSEMAITDKFCASCGQKVQRRIPKLWELISEFFDSVLNIDSKIIRTFKAIFVPGQLTIQYFKGIRKKYYQPFRLFFFVSVLFFTVLGFSGAKKSIMAMNQDNSVKNIRQKVEASKKIKEYKEEVSGKFQDSLRAVSVLDSLNKVLDVEMDTINIKLAANYGDYRIASKDILTLSGEEIIEKYEIKGFWNQLFAKQTIKTVKDPSGFTWYMVGNLIWMLILLMPAVASVLKLFYIRRKRYFVEHLTFLFHFHSFAFLLATLIIVIGGYISNSRLYLILAIGIPLYLLIAMLRFYKQGVFKTFVKFFMLILSYFILSTIFFVFMTIISLAMY